MILPGDHDKNGVTSPCRCAEDHVRRQHISGKTVSNLTVCVSTPRPDGPIKCECDAVIAPGVHATNVALNKDGQCGDRPGIVTDLSIGIAAPTVEITPKQH